MKSPDVVPTMEQIDGIANGIFVSDLPEPESEEEPEETNNKQQSKKSISLKDAFDTACSRYNLSPISAREAITG
jgi:hypothetical protein